MGFFERLKDGLQKTRKNFTERIEVLVGMSAEIDDDFLDELEMILLSADVGAKTTEKLIEAVRQAARKKEIKGTEDVVPFLKKYLTQMLTEEGQRTRISGTPTVILVVGVNGVGKTTTIGKLANYFHLPILSAPLLPNSWKSGASAPAAMLLSTQKARTRRQLFLTP